MDEETCFIENGDTCRSENHEVEPVVSTGKKVSFNHSFSFDKFKTDSKNIIYIVSIKVSNMYYPLNISFK